VAWVQQTNALVQNPPQDIKLLEQWPGKPSVEQESTAEEECTAERRGTAITEVIAPKVPSEISYSQSRNRQKQWGFSIDEYSTVLKWTKLELMPHSPTTQLAVLKNLLKDLSVLKELQKHNDFDNKIENHLVKSVVDIISDYLFRVASEWHGCMTAVGAGALPNLDLDIVVTHPTVELLHLQRFEIIDSG
jgi:hypothetical protein